MLFQATLFDKVLVTKHHLRKTGKRVSLQMINGLSVNCEDEKMDFSFYIQPMQIQKMILSGQTCN